MDYVIGSPFLLTAAQNMKVLEFDPLFSDVHCGTSLSIKNSSDFMEQECWSGERYHKRLTGKKCYHIVSKSGHWDQHKADDYVSNTNQELVTYVRD